MTRTPLQIDPDEMALSPLHIKVLCDQTTWLELLSILIYFVNSRTIARTPLYIDLLREQSQYSSNSSPCVSTPCPDDKALSPHYEYLLLCQTTRLDLLAIFIPFVNIRNTRAYFNISVLSDHRGDMTPSPLHMYLLLDLFYL